MNAVPGDVNGDCLFNMLVRTSFWQPWYALGLCDKQAYLSLGPSTGDSKASHA